MKISGKPVEWIDNAGHNSNTDRPDVIKIGVIHKFEKCAK